jgi:hypothetical protein
MADTSLESSLLSSERTSVRARTAAVCLCVSTRAKREPSSRVTYLFVNDSAEPGLALDDSVGNAHLAAEGGEEDDKLDGVNIVGDEDERGLLVLNEADNVVETVLDNIGLLADVLLFLALLDGRGFLEKTLLLLGLGLGTVLVEELEGLGSRVLVEDVLELRDRRRDLEAEVEDLLLALETDVLGPLHHARQVALGLDVLANAVVACPLLDERVLVLCQPSNDARPGGSEDWD